MLKLQNALKDFAAEFSVNEKGALCVGLVITRHARDLGLPLDPDNLLTPKGGQVKGLGKASVQAILADHSITRVLAEEGGRTSRGSIDNMRKYVAFLNEIRDIEDFDLTAIESWWIERVKDLFASKPFILRYDTAKSLRSIVKDLLLQAQARQEEGSGTTYVGTVLQHLVGAKLSLLLGEDAEIEFFGASVADQPGERKGDFFISDVAIHVTTAPGEAVIRKCRSNIDASYRPVLITLGKGVAIAEGLAEQAGIADRLDVFEAEQFLAGNLYEIGRFLQDGRRNTAEGLVERYNRIIDECETDPGLKIQVGS